MSVEFAMGYHSLLRDTLSLLCFQNTSPLGFPLHLQFPLLSPPLLSEPYTWTASGLGPLVSASSSSPIYLIIHVSPLWAQLNCLDLGKSQICISSQTSLWSWAYNCLLDTSWFLSQTHPLCTAFDLRGLLFHLSNCSGGKFFFHAPEESPFILRLLTIFRFLSLLTIAFTTALSKSPWQDLPWMHQSPLSCQDDPLTVSQTCLSPQWPSLKRNTPSFLKAFHFPLEAPEDSG